MDPASSKKKAPTKMTKPSPTPAATTTTTTNGATTVPVVASATKEGTPKKGTPKPSPSNAAAAATKTASSSVKKDSTKQSHTSSAVAATTSAASATNTKTTPNKAIPTTVATSVPSSQTKTVSSSKKKVIPNNNTNDNDNNDDDTNDSEVMNTSNDTPKSSAIKATTNTAEVGNVHAAAKASTSSPKQSSVSKSKGKTYIQLVEEAINALKEYRTGSSLASIKKYIITNYPTLDGPAFNSRLYMALKNGCDPTCKPVPKFLKVKVSYRISPEYKIWIANNKRRLSRQKSSSTGSSASNKNQKSKQKTTVSKGSSPNNGKNTASKEQQSNGTNNQSMNGSTDSSNDHLSEEERKIIEERKQKRLAAIQQKAEADARNKQIAEKIRRRKFPMEDTKLHLEDKLYNVKPPNHVTTRPYLPYFWHSTIQPFDHPKRTSGKTNATILSNSKVEDHNITIHDTRGIVPDLLHIYHFFRGDVHCNLFFTTKNTTGSSNKNDDDSTMMIVPNFTLQQLIYNVELMLNGTMKRTKCVPPLIVHLFVTCLQILTSLPSSTASSTDATAPKQQQGSMIEEPLNKDEKQLRKDFYHYLYPAISPASWSDVTYLYMDAMQRYYTTNSSLTTTNISNSSGGSGSTTMIQPLVTDVNYLFGRTDEPNIVPLFSSPSPKKKVESIFAQQQNDNKNENDDDDDENIEHDTNMMNGTSTVEVVSQYEPQQQHPLPEGYVGYLGDERSTLHKAHTKLARQDPWLLMGEEILALLRALTEDVLASHPSISYDMEHREEQMIELLKNKRSADMKFRKVRLAYEGPKKPVRPKPTTTSNSTSDVTKEDGKSENFDYVKENEEKGNDDNNNSNTGTSTSTVTGKPFVPTATKKQYETALKLQEKANDAYEKGIRKFVARTEPVGYDRNYSAFYCFLRHPEVLYIEDKKPASTTNFTSSSSIIIPSDMQFPRTTWHIIETTSLCDRYASSLDIRGKREYDLYEVLMGPSGSNSTSQSLYRYLHDDLKEMADAKSKVREKAALLEKLKMAQIKCDEEKGRRSGRLAGQAEIELIQIQNEIDELEMITNKKKKNSAAVTTLTTTATEDYRELTGYNLLIQFESTSRGADMRRATRDKKVQQQGVDTSLNAIVKRLPLLGCSKVCPTGNIDGTGLVGMIVSSMLDLEEHCNELSTWARTDMTRHSWINRLENAVTLWSSISPDLYSSESKSPSEIDSPMDTSSRSISKRDSIGSEMSSSTSKRQRTMTSSPAPVQRTSQGGSLPTVPTIVTILKQALIDLEERVADITNVALATKDSDMADDNMSTENDDDVNQERLVLEWKRLVHKLRSVPARRNTRIRDGLVNAINAARKAHLQQVVTELRAALLLFRPNAPHDSKMAAIQVLVAHGDYEVSNDDNDDEDIDDEEDDDNEDEHDETKPSNNDDTPPEEVVQSVLSAEGAILRSSLGGSDDARREDWVGMVKSVRTLSRLASLTTAFIHDAMEKIVKVESERDELTSAIQIWSKAEERQSKQREAAQVKVKSNSSSTTPKEIKRPSEVWADVRYTDEICMAKTDEYPWWPAKVCVAKDPDIAKSLQQLKRSLVAFVGEMGSLRVVKTNCTRPFTGQVIMDDDADTMDYYKKDIRNQLDDCMAMARRIQRGLAKQKAK